MPVSTNEFAQETAQPRGWPDAHTQAVQMLNDEVIDVSQALYIAPFATGHMRDVPAPNRATTACLNFFKPDFNDE